MSINAKKSAVRNQLTYTNNQLTNYLDVSIKGGGGGGGSGGAANATNIAGGSAGVVPYQTAPDTTAFTAVGTVGQILQSNGTFAPTWVNPAAATNVLITSDNMNATYYLTFAKTTGTGNKQLYIDETGTGALTFNPALSTVKALIFQGDLSGNATSATNATNVGITSDNTAGTYFIPFTKTSGTGNKPLFIDDATTPLTYNPSTGLLTTTNIITTSTQIGIGLNAGVTSQGTSAVAIGNVAGQTSQGTESVAIGRASGNSVQGQYAVAIGVVAGQTNQGTRCVALGSDAGQTNQGTESVAIGRASGNSGQGQYSVAIGVVAGQTNQGTRCIAIGSDSGKSGQGNFAVAIGYLAGTTNQHTNSIIFNGTGSALDSDGSSRFFVKPIRGVATATPVLVYNTSTGEITYNTSSIKYKKNVIDLQTDTSSIYNVRAREYDWKEDDKHFIGYIAEELDAIDTNFTWKQNDEPEGIEWFNLLLYTIEEMKKLKARVDELERSN